ncbi:MAG TPA: hypothetical protein PLX08_10425 [Bacteroidales bacterium]|jgi:hypothetical protein|nr:hypothetical protein [Bacteroidales bacterium]
MRFLFALSILFNLNILIIRAQDFPTAESNDTAYMYAGGFLRGGTYAWRDHESNKLYFPAVFSDFALKLEAGRRGQYGIYADLRFRYGAEFGKPVNRLDLREAWVSYSPGNFAFSAGRKIVKYGRCDFTNPTSKLSPANYIYHSPDKEDLDMGNILFSAKYFPSVNFDIEAVFLPCYSPSFLIIEPVEMPSFVTLNKLPDIVAGKNMYSYSFRASVHLRQADWSVSWFDGFDPLPGISLDDFILDLNSLIPSMSAVLSVTPYKNRVAGFDFETTAGMYGIRCEAAYSNPAFSYGTGDKVLMPEIKWAAGIDRPAGNWRLTAEYSGKLITDFIHSEADPLLGSEHDMTAVMELLSLPGFDPEYYVTQQIIAFNRLYNNQLKRMYNSLALRIEAELGYGKFLPSFLSVYNITTRDLLLIPEIRLKPGDGFTLAFGAEIYSGRKGSLYDLIDDFMNGAYLSMRVDF